MFSRRYWIVLFFLVILSGCTSPQPTPPPHPNTTSSPLPPANQTLRPANTSTPQTLHLPDLETLLRVIHYGINLEQDAWENFDYPTFHGDFLTSPEARALFDFVQADLERYYPEGIPYAAKIFANRELNPNIWFPPRAVWTLAQSAVTEQLGAEELTLKLGTTLTLDPFTLTPIQLELDADPAPEWLVEVTSQTYNLHGWFPLDENVGDPYGYTLIPNDIRHENLARAKGTTLQITPDLNGDRLQDIVIYFDGQPLGTQFGELKVYGRVGNGINLLDTFALEPGSRFQIGDYDGDGFSDIQISRPRTMNFECEWTEEFNFRWRGDDFVFTLKDEPPETSICNAARAISPVSYLAPKDRIHLLEESLTAFKSEIALSEDYLAILKIHLAMLYASQDLDKEAIQYMGDLPDWAKTVWEEIPIFPAFCNNLYSNAVSGLFDSTDLAQYLTPNAILQSYNRKTVSVGEVICPLEAWAEYRLETLSPPTNQLPGDYWPELGTAISDATPYQLDSDADEEWLGWINWKAPQILLLDLQGSNWQIFRLKQETGPLAKFQSRVVDFDQDGLDEILLLTTFDESVPVSAYPKCLAEGAAQVNVLTRLNWFPNTVVNEETKVLCGEPPTVDALSNFQLLDWFTESTPLPPSLRSDPNGFYRRLEEQERLLFSGENLHETRSALEEMLATVPADHPAASFVIPRILFGIGLSYEIEGDNESARARFLDLIAQWPDSPWAWVAEARAGN